MLHKNYEMSYKMDYKFRLNYGFRSITLSLNTEFYNFKNI